MSSRSGSESGVARRPSPGLPAFGLALIAAGCLAPALTAPAALDWILRAAPPAEAPAVALLVDLALVAVFGLQHSVMARPAWRAGWGRRLDPALERPTYTLASGLALALVFAAWRPIGGVAWGLESPAAAWAAWIVCGAGWALAGLATLAMGGGEILGLPQLRTLAAGRRYEPPRFRAPGPYRAVRHPIMLGILVGMWSGPLMTFDRLVLVAGMSVYVIVGIVLEERDLLREFGEPYRTWRARTPMLVPRLAARSASAEEGRR